MIRVFGVCVLVISIAWFTMVFGVSDALFDGTSLATTIGVGLLFTLSWVSPKALFRAFDMAISARKMTPVAIAHAIRTLRHLSSSVLAGGCSVTLISFMTMLCEINDPSALGPSIAKSLLGIFYAGIVAGLLLEPLSRGLERKLLQCAATGEDYPFNGPSFD